MKVVIQVSEKDKIPMGNIVGSHIAVLKDVETIEVVFLEGDINYFNTQEDAEMARQSVRKLLENDFDYVDGLHESVHLLENRYGEKIVPMEQIPGPVIVLYHFKNLKDAIEKAMSVKNCNFINIFTDSFNAVDFAKSRTGIEILRNVESSRALLV